MLAQALTLAAFSLCVGFTAFSFAFSIWKFDLLGCNQMTNLAFKEYLISLYSGSFTVCFGSLSGLQHFAESEHKH